MQVTSKGQVTIPKKFRDMLGLLPYTEVEFEENGNGLIIRKSRDGQRRGKKKPSPGEAMIRRMVGKGGLRMTTDEIMALTRGED